MLGDAELHTVPARCRAGDCLPGEGMRAVGLAATSQECLANTAERGQCIVVAAASDVAVLPTCFLGDRGGRGRFGGPLAKTGVLATLDRSNLGGCVAVLTLLKLLLAFVLVATSTIRNERFKYFSQASLSQISPHLQSSPPSLA